MIGQTLAHYQITAKLGEGGMGEVYRARDTRLDRDVALKILPRELSGDPERAARFEREAQTLATLQHPNVASIYGYEQDGDTRFLAMELVEGEDLAERIDRGAIPPQEAIALARQIALGIEAAHERGIVHRDLKPANIRVTAAGVAKVLDFGLARATMPEAGDGTALHNSPTITAAMTQAGTILGTAAYMSPEQARGKATDKRTDIWAYGVILFEMLCGKRLYDGETITDILGAIVHGRPDLDELPASCPLGVRRLLGRCLEPEHEQRLRDIGEARYMLDHLDEAGAAVAAPRPGRAPWVVAGVAVLVALAAAAGLWLRPAPEPLVVQASISLGEDRALGITGARGGAMRFSPDGQSIAYVGSDGGQRQIWVRRLSEAEGRPVTGTEGGHRPFWSPDSRSLGFFLEGSMRRVPADGGAPLTITRVQDGRGGCWMEDGTIIYSPSPTSSLRAISSAGGESRELNTLDGSGGHREPRRLGLDDRFLFLDSQDGGQWYVSVGYLDGRPSERITATGGGAEYSAGHLLFLRGRTLVAQPFDPSSLELSGEARPLAEGIVRDADFGIGAFGSSRDGKLAYVAGRGADGRIIRVDRQGRELEQLGQPGDYSQLSISRDGSQAILSLTDREGRSDLWLMDLASGALRRFTVTPQGQEMRRTELVWSADDSRVYYTAEASGSTSIRTKPVDGSGGEELVLESPGDALWSYDTSDDGKWLFFGRESLDSSTEDLWGLPLDGSGEARVLYTSPFDEWPWDLSPDGNWLAFDSDEAGRREVFVVPFPPGTGKWQVSREGGRFPTWSDDGRELFFQDPAGFILATPVRGEGGRLQVGQPERLFRTQAQGATKNYVPGPDGGNFIMVEDLEHSADMSLYLNWQAAIARR